MVFFKQEIVQHDDFSYKFDIKIKIYYLYYQIYTFYIQSDDLKEDKEKAQNVAKFPSWNDHVLTRKCDFHENSKLAGLLSLNKHVHSHQYISMQEVIIKSRCHSLSLE